VVPTRKRALRASVKWMWRVVRAGVPARGVVGVGWWWRVWWVRVSVLVRFVGIVGSEAAAVVGRVGEAKTGRKWSRL